MRPNFYLSWLFFCTKRHPCKGGLEQKLSVPLLVRYIETGETCGEPPSKNVILISDVHQWGYFRALLWLGGPCNYFHPMSCEPPLLMWNIPEPSFHLLWHTDCHTWDGGYSTSLNLESLKWAQPLADPWLRWNIRIKPLLFKSGNGKPYPIGQIWSVVLFLCCPWTKNDFFIFLKCCLKNTKYTEKNMGQSTIGPQRLKYYYLEPRTKYYYLD